MADRTPKNGELNKAPVVSRQERRRQIEEEKQITRDRVRNTHAEPKAEYYNADPKPTIDDSSPKRVAAYARVSTTSADQVSSIENQTKYYTEKIEKTPNWSMYQIYSDEGKSGTSMRKREAFLQMLKDAADEKFDLIICASVSRFARNIADSIEQVRILRTQNPAHPVGVFFETENLFTLDANSDDRFEIHSMLADWESRNKSRRMILSYDQRIAMGQYPVADLLGYRHTRDGQLIIQEDEADTVRYIYLARIIGTPFAEIARVLTEKERPTLTGRTSWNANMVANIMKNERRWGDLEVRKTIVIDYKLGKVAKNTTVRNGVVHHERNGAKVRKHHEGIVSPELARIAGKVKLTKNGVGGISDIFVLDRGALKGFVNVSPFDFNISHDVMLGISRSVYTKAEMKALGQMIRIQSGESHSNVIAMGFQDYFVPRSCFFIGRYTPSLTITTKALKLNKAAIEGLGSDAHLQIIYHPIQKILAFRTADAFDENAFSLVSKGGHTLDHISAPDFCAALYSGMDWISRYGFRFRGVLRQKGDRRIMVFYLDEPQVLPDKATREQLDVGGENATTRYIPHHNYELLERDPTENGFRQAGDAWIPAITREHRNAMLSALTDADIGSQGRFAQNPLLTDIPTKKEIMEEIDSILMSM